MSSEPASEGGERAGKGVGRGRRMSWIRNDQASELTDAGRGAGGRELRERGRDLVEREPFPARGGSVQKKRAS